MDKCSCDDKTTKRLLRSSEDLQVLLDRQSMPLHSLQVELPWLSVDENASLERRFNGYINGCGCDVGGYFTIAGIVFCVILGSTDVLEFSWRGIGYAALISLGFGFTGKTLGLIVARMMFFRLVRKLLEAKNPGHQVALK